MLGTSCYIVPHTRLREGKEGGKRLIENPNSERELGRERRGKLRNKQETKEREEVEEEGGRREEATALNCGFLKITH